MQEQSCHQTAPRMTDECKDSAIKTYYYQTFNMVSSAVESLSLLHIFILLYGEAILAIHQSKGTWYTLKQRSEGHTHWKTFWSSLSTKKMSNVKLRKAKDICMLILTRKNTSALLHLQRGAVWVHVLIWSSFSLMPHWAYMLHRPVSLTTGMWDLFNCSAGMITFGVQIRVRCGALGCQCFCICFSQVLKQRTLKRISLFINTMTWI